MFCRNCGKELTGTPEICLGCGAKPLAGNDFCLGCGAQTTSLTEICMKCGTRQIKRMPGERSGVLTAGGIITIIVGGIGILSGILVAGTAMPSLDYEYFVWWLYIVMGVLSIALGILAIVGGIYALKKERFTLTLIGAISALVSSLFILYIAPAGIAAIVLIAMSRNEFK